MMWHRSRLQWWGIAVALHFLALNVPAQRVADDKTGTCPEFSASTSDLCVIECSKDSECPGDNKCCPLLSCGSMCTSPILTTSPKQTEKNQSSSDPDCQNECDNSRQCQKFSLCVREGCKRVCKSFRKSKPKSKPTLAAHKPPTITHQRNCADQCLRNVHCEKGFICVPKGCRNICEKPAGQSHIGQTLKSKTEDCNDRCTSSIHCPFRYNCIQDGCRKVCRKPETKILFDTDRKKSLLSITSNNCEIQCMYDLDCPKGLTCFDQGCNTTCIMRQVAPINNEALTSGIISKMSSISNANSDRLMHECRDECTKDSHCIAGFYCRRRGCRKICRPGQDRTKPIVHILTAMPPKPTQPITCTNECNTDLDCILGEKCRQIGCKRVCKNEIHSCIDQCKRDSDCLIGHICLQNGCKRECKEHSITTTPIPQSCKHDCLKSRDCEFGYICVAEGCKNICKQYQATRSSRIDQDILSNNCNIECSRGSDCPSNQICIQEGCNRLCARTSRGNNEERSQRGVSSSTDSCVDQCSRDTECVNAYCRQKGCRRECVSVDSFSTAAGQALIDTNNNFPSGRQNMFDTQRSQCRTECFNTAQCPRLSTCIQNGCSRTCEDQTLGRFNP